MDIGHHNDYTFEEWLKMCNLYDDLEQYQEIYESIEDNRKKELISTFAQEIDFLINANLDGKLDISELAINLYSVINEIKTHRIKLSEVFLNVNKKSIDKVILNIEKLSFPIPSKVDRCIDIETLDNLITQIGFIVSLYLVTYHLITIDNFIEIWYEDANEYKSKIKAFFNIYMIGDEDAR